MNPPFFFFPSFPFSPQFLFGRRPEYDAKAPFFFSPSFPSPPPSLFSPNLTARRVRGYRDGDFDLFSLFPPPLLLPSPSSRRLQYESKERAHMVLWDGRLSFFPPLPNPRPQKWRMAARSATGSFLFPFFPFFFSLKRSAMHCIRVFSFFPPPSFFSEKLQSDLIRG